MTTDVAQVTSQRHDTSADRRGDGLFTFPDPVDEIAARTVAGGVLGLSCATFVLSLTAGPDWLWLSVALAYGFLARVATGPTLSPLGQLATRVVAPRLGPARPVPGPPKRFAQGIGAFVTTAIVILTAAGQYTAADALLAMIIVFAGLESVFAVCVGCRIFAVLMRAGIIPASRCEACSDLTLRRPSPS